MVKCVGLEWVNENVESVDKCMTPRVLGGKKKLSESATSMQWKKAAMYVYSTRAKR
jgi:hypothetical protein